MATSLKEFSTTAASNTAVGTANVDENCPPSGINNAIRQALAYIVDWFMNTGTISSATTTDLGTKTQSYLSVTGTTTITGFGTPTNKTEYTLTFAGALTLTHNATSLILPGGANITTAAGDVAVMKHEGSGNWRCVSYTKASGVAVVSFSKTDITGQSALTTPDHAADYLLISDTSDSGNLKKVLPKYISPVVARYYAEYTSSADLATVIPLDDTIPTSTEGTQILSISVTTTTATQRVRLKCIGNVAAPTTVPIMAAFRDTTCIQVSNQYLAFSGSYYGALGLEVEEAPGSAATFTYTIRVGASSGTMRMNGTTSGRLFGGAAKTVLIIEVIEP